MRMSGHHFVADRIRNTVKGEKPLLLSDCSVIDRLQQ